MWGCSFAKPILLCLLALFAAVPLPAEAQLPEPTEVEAVLKPGDVLRITVWRSEELSGEFDVAGDGTLRHPLYRRLRVTDVALAEVERRIQALLEEFEAAPDFVVQPLFRVAVAGEVRQPNLYAFVPETTLSQAVASAGGPTERGRLDQVRLLRDGRESVVDLTGADGTALQTRIRSGDQILVGRRAAVWREVIAPAATLTAAVAALVSAVIRASD